jgi:hypothetical protein
MNDTEREQAEQAEIAAWKSRPRSARRRKQRLTWLMLVAAVAVIGTAALYAARPAPAPVQEAQRPAE